MEELALFSVTSHRNCLLPASQHNQSHCTHTAQQQREGSLHQLWMTASRQLTPIPAPWAYAKPCWKKNSLLSGGSSLLPVHSFSVYLGLGKRSVFLGKFFWHVPEGLVSSTRSLEADPRLVFVPRKWFSCHFIHLISLPHCPVTVFSDFFPPIAITWVLFCRHGYAYYIFLSCEPHCRPSALQIFITKCLECL